MKQLLENWKAYLAENDQPDDDSWLTSLQLSPDQKVFGTSEEFNGFRPVAQSTQPGMKPQGLWYGCGNDWLQWVQSEMPEWLSGYKYLYEIELNTESVMMIDTNQKLKYLDQAYKYAGVPGLSLIDWNELSQTRLGVEICPYQKESRYGMMWYYGWDVASGCIWDAAAIKDVKLIARRS